MYQFLRALRPRRHTTLILIGFFLIGTGRLLNASAATEEQTGFFSVTEENDSLSNPTGSHQDRHYTQGLKVILFGGDNYNPGMTNAVDRFLPAWGYHPEAGDLGWIVLGQNIYTPAVIANRIPDPRDRPYAGWLYTGAVYQRRGELAPNLAVMENFEFNIGVVGPQSLAEPSQVTLHHWLFGTNDIPHGWDHQLRTEPGLELKYARLWRWSPALGLTNHLDVIPIVGGELGNVQIFATGGATLRLGWHLPTDFGPQIIDSPASANGGLTRSSPPAYAYLFGSADGRVVGRDITLDGNSFHDGPSVSKDILVGDLSWGFAVQFLRYFDVSYMRVLRTREFHTQKNDDIFGSLTLKGTFKF